MIMIKEIPSKLHKLETISPRMVGHRTQFDMYVCSSANETSIDGENVFLPFWPSSVYSQLTKSCVIGILRQISSEG